MGHPAFALSLTLETKTLGEDGDVFYAGGAEDAAIAIDLAGRAHGLHVIVRQLHGGPAFDFGQLADQAHGIKAAIAPWVAVAKVIGQQRAPAGAETNAAIRRP